MSFVNYMEGVRARMRAIRHKSSIHPFYTPAPPYLLSHDEKHISLQKNSAFDVILCKHIKSDCLRTIAFYYIKYFI